MKRQLILGALGFTITVKHRGKTVKVEMPLEAPGATIDIGCDLCEKRFKSQQGLGVHKLVHMKRESKEVHQLRAPTEYEIVRDVVSSLVREASNNLRNEVEGNTHILKMFVSDYSLSFHKNIPQSGLIHVYK